MKLPWFAVSRSHSSNEKNMVRYNSCAVIVINYNSHRSDGWNNLKWISTMITSVSNQMIGTFLFTSMNSVTKCGFKFAFWYEWCQQRVEVRLGSGRDQRSCEICVKCDILFQCCKPISSGDSRMHENFNERIKWRQIFHLNFSMNVFFTECFFRSFFFTLDLRFYLSALFFVFFLRLCVCVCFACFALEVNISV